MTVRIAHQLGPAEHEWLLSILPRDVTLTALPGETPWDVPMGTQILLIGHGVMPTISQARPSWAEDLSWVHIRPTGIDDAPDWLLKVPHVTLSRGASAGGIAEYVLSAMLNFARPLTPVRNPSAWVNPPHVGLEGKTLGLVGYGAIGQAIRARAVPFGMTVCATSRSMTPTDDGTELVTLPDLCAQSDHLVLCAPLTPSTRDLFNDVTFAHCREGQHLINVARGGLIVPDALRAALDGPIARATLDVWTEEPPAEGHWIYHHPKVHLTPHCSFQSQSMQAHHRETLRRNLGVWLAERPEALFGRVQVAQGY